MKKIILSLFVLSMAAATQAQENNTKQGEKTQQDGKRFHHRGMHHTMDMKALNLTEEQKTKFKSQSENFRKQMEDLKKKEGISADEKKAAFQKLREEQKASMSSILTTEQKDQLQKLRAEAKQKRADMGKDRGTLSKDRSAMMKERSEKMKAELGLTDEQSAKLQANRKEMGEKMKAIRENKSLSDEQKKEQFKELMKGQKEKMKSILTEEQLKKMKESHHRRPGGGERDKPETKQSSI